MPSIAGCCAPRWGRSGINSICCRRVTATVRCLLGGGAAGVVQPHLDLPLERVDNLVLKGIADHWRDRKHDEVDRGIVVAGQPGVVRLDALGQHVDRGCRCGNGAGGIECGQDQIAGALPASAVRCGVKQHTGLDADLVASLGAVVATLDMSASAPRQLSQPPRSAPVCIDTCCRLLPRPQRPKRQVVPNGVNFPAMI